MRAVVQRVTSASVTVDHRCTGKIDQGMVVLLGVGSQDTNKDVDYMVEKITGLRIFDDSEGKMNLSLTDINGAMLVVSQFTLYGDCRKGKRPSWSDAAKPQVAEELYDQFIEKVKRTGIVVASGVFQAEMLVEINNDGPVTLLIDSTKSF
ncbi:MAG TPA: D-tyrosyl-tRNA(Tyr) deacylase [Clostridiales bacterium]|nr:D-tyrosyl-tRNA(Tyr) deacylase [Clostridiales bacterium]